MSRLTGEFKRGSLRSLYRACTQASLNQSQEGTQPVLTLQGALDAFQDAGFAGVQSGRLVAMSSSAGRTVTFQVPQIWQSMTQEDVFALSEELEQVYADAKARLIAQGTPTPDDATLFKSMMADDRLATITDVRKDFTGMRFPNRYG